MSHWLAEYRGVSHWWAKYRGVSHWNRHPRSTLLCIDVNVRQKITVWNKGLTSNHVVVIIQLKYV